jgi:tetratricopeptide (TPR) repeat protein
MVKIGRYGVDYSKELTEEDYKKVIVETTKIIDEKSVSRTELVYAYYSRGIALDEQNEYEKAIADYTFAVELDKIFGPAFYNRAIAYYCLGEYDKALSDVNEALQRWPYWSEASKNEANEFIDDINDKLSSYIHNMF